MSQRMMGCEYLSRMLKEYGVTHVFHIEAMLRMTIKEMEKLGVKAIMAHSENGAGYMADGYARISGRPGVCMAQSIGAANLAGGIEDAYLAGSPVIALTGKKIPYHQYRNSYQESDHRLFFEGITKFNAEVTIADQLPYLMRQCFRAVTTGKPRPAHLDIPNRMGRTIEVAGIKEAFAIEPRFGAYPPFRPSADEEDINKALKRIETADKPIIVIGRGARLSDAGPEILKLAHKADIPVVTTPDGKTVINEIDPLWSGICGEYGMECANKALAAADLVIFIGTQTNDQTTYDWKCPPVTTKAIQIDIEPSELGRNYPDTVGLLGDAKVVTGQLADGVMALGHKVWKSEVAEYFDETMKEYEERVNCPSDCIRPEKLCAEVSKALPDDAVLVADTGFAAVWTSVMLRMKDSQRYIRAAGSLGWAFPGALGVKCGVPNRPVICFTGDGGFYYHMSEMETALRYGINTVTVINNNGILKQCAGDIDNIFKNKDMSSKHYTFAPVNFSRVAEEMGLLGIRVEKAEDIAPAIQKALECGRPAIVEVMTAAEIGIPPAMRAR